VSMERSTADIRRKVNGTKPKPSMSAMPQIE
jgi:hypothetical protein